MINKNNKNKTFKKAIINLSFFNNKWLNLKKILNKIMKNK